MSNTEERDWVGPTEVREILKVNRSRAYELTQRKDFPAPAYEQGLVRRWNRAEVEAYQAQRTSDTQESEA